MPSKCDIKQKYIYDYIEKIESGKTPANKEIKKAVALIRKKLDNSDIFFDVKKTQKAKQLIEKYFFKLLDWELLVLALVHCYYTNDTVVFDEFLIVVGTGNGKNGFISALTWYFATHYHGVKEYDIDIVANSEEQAMTSFNDIYRVLERTWDISKHFFYKSKTIIRNLKTGSEIRYNTSNARTRLGKRAGCLIFDEMLAYENWVVFNAFNASFGKIKHSRKFFITTNGYLRQGFLDDYTEIADKVLKGEIKNSGLLPLIYKLDDKEEVHDPDMWVKANPSLPYFPELQKTLKDEYEKIDHHPQLAVDYLTKRMNLPTREAHAAVASWEKIMATNQELPLGDLAGMECIGALDYAEVRDFAGVGLLFKYGGKRYWISHTFACDKALKMKSRPFKAPIQQWIDAGMITVVKDLITAEHITDWFLEKLKTYNIKMVVADLFRARILSDQFKKVGLPLKIVRSGSRTHTIVSPLLETMFAEENLVYGDNPVMRWMTNNTAREVDKKGNITFIKIEPVLRKNDTFMALIHALSVDDELEEIEEGEGLSLDVAVY